MILGITSCGHPSSVVSHHINGSSQDSSQLSPMITASPFYDPTLTNIPFHGQTVPYDPHLISVMASLESRQHSQSHRYPPQDKTFEMPSQGIDPLCSGPIKAYVRRSKTAPHSSASSPTFVILPGSFSEQATGGHVNKIVDILDEHSTDYHLISTDGILTPKFIQHSCSGIPWNQKLMAQDFYHRLQTLIIRLGQDVTNTALVGTSGGGSLGAAMLSYASEQPTPLFQRGALLISPVISSTVAFDNIDTKVSQTHHRRVLEDPLYFSHLLIRFLWQRKITIHALDMLTVYQRNPKDFIDRFYNQFSYIHLKQTIKAAKLTSDNSRHLQSYQHIFTHLAPQASGESDPKQAFNQANNMEQILAHISTKTLITFSLDDPLLSDAQKPQSVIRSMFESASTNPHLHLYTPPYGSHIGAFLDPALPSLISFAFNLK